MAQHPYREPGAVDENPPQKRELPTYDAVCKLASSRREQTKILFEAATTALHQLDRAHAALRRLRDCADSLAEDAVPARWIEEETARVLRQHAFFFAAVHLLTEASGAERRTPQVEWAPLSNVEIEEVQSHLAELMRQRAMDALGDER